MIALLGDSVFDNENFVKSKKEAVESVIRKSGYECKLYAVDGAMISNFYSQIEKLKSESETIYKIVLSVGGNNALSSFIEILVLNLYSFIVIKLRIFWLGLAYRYASGNPNRMDGKKGTRQSLFSQIGGANHQ